jgi:hypothetical protein
LAYRRNPEDPRMTVKSTQGGLALVWVLVGIFAAGALLFALHIWIMLSWNYSSGERAGWVQKLSKKGFLCKTWEGEMAMVSLPGAMPEKFQFTVWNDETAAEINRLIGRRVALTYEEHIWLPSTCFGETRHFVNHIKLIEDTPAPMLLPSNPGSSSAPLAPPAANPGGALEPHAPDAQGRPAPGQPAGPPRPRVPES